MTDEQVPKKKYVLISLTSEEHDKLMRMKGSMKWREWLMRPGSSLDDLRRED